MNLCGVVRLNGDFISTIAESLIGIKVLDLEQCPDIRLSDLQHLLTIKKVSMPASEWSRDLNTGL